MNVNCIKYAYNIFMIIVNVHNIAWKKHHTQKDVIEKTGMGSDTVSRLWKGEHYNFTLETIETLAKYFGCNALDLLVEVPDED